MSLPAVLTSRVEPVTERLPSAFQLVCAISVTPVVDTVRLPAAKRWLLPTCRASVVRSFSEPSVRVLLPPA